MIYSVLLIAANGDQSMVLKNLKTQLGQKFIKEGKCGNVRARNRDLTEKYKDTRQKQDCIYASRILNTFFNKFIKKGKKALSSRQIIEALINFRFYFKQPCTKFLLFFIFKDLRKQFTLLPRRKSKIILYVPSPLRRNKRDALASSDLFKSIRSRKERTIKEKIFQELQTILAFQEQSATLRAAYEFEEDVYEERTNMDYR